MFTSLLLSSSVESCKEKKVRFSSPSALQNAFKGWYEVCLQKMSEVQFYGGLKFANIEKVTLICISRQKAI